jgi:hypothetical protein
MASELRNLFDFDAEDLSYNRSGSLSPQQAARYAKRGFGLTVILYLLVLLVGAGLVAGALGLLPIPVTGSTVMILWASAVILLLFGAAGLAFAFRKPDLSIMKAEGNARLIRRSEATPNRTVYLVHEIALGDEILDISEEAFLKLKEGERYTAYYLKDAKHIISIEHHPAEEA